MDDLYLINNKNAFSENIDYYSAQVTIHNLYKCWRNNNSICIKTESDDISSIIPSSQSRRLENLCWRRWFKDLNSLSSLPPREINWFKEQDITWLYGPKYDNKAFGIQTTSPSINQEIDFQEDDNVCAFISSTTVSHAITIPKVIEEDECEYLSSSLESNITSYSMGSSATSFTSMESDYQETQKKTFEKHSKITDTEIIHCSLKLALRLKQHIKNKKDRKVKFNYIVNSREFVNGMSFDYDFLDDCSYF